MAALYFVQLYQVSKVTCLKTITRFMIELNDLSFNKIRIMLYIHIFLVIQYQQVRFPSALRVQRD